MRDTSQRRTSPRHRFSCQARFQNLYAPQMESERPCVTKDFSRDGVYFIADDTGLRENMRLLMWFPEGLSAEQEHEYLVEIKRLNSLPDERCGVGARLILRGAVGRCRNMIAPKPDLSIYARMQAASWKLVDFDA
jgi:hypothetical protein